jgi:alpha-1,2-glucosyltransferase
MFPDFLISSLFVISAFLAVHYNTIIHPYTLADNRHYVFYVFRILRQHPAIRYLAVPVYYASAWLALQCLASVPNGEHALGKNRDNARPTSGMIGCSPCKISFITIWLITTALSVMTARASLLHYPLDPLAVACPEYASLTQLKRKVRSERL